MFTINKNLPAHGKFIAWFAIIMGVITVFSPFISNYRATEPFPYAFHLVAIMIGLASVYAGINIFKDEKWAFWLFIFLYLILSVEYFSPNFSFSLISPISFRVGWTWTSPMRVINVNLFTLIPVFIANSNITRLLKTDNAGNEEAQTSNIANK